MDNFEDQGIENNDTMDGTIVTEREAFDVATVLTRMDGILGQLDEIDVDGPFTAPKKKEQIFPPELRMFTYAHAMYLVCGNEKAPNSPADDDDNYLEVAQKIEGYNDGKNEGNYNLILDRLTCKNLRLLAKQFGIKNLGSKTKFEIRLALAEKKNSNNRYNIDAFASSKHQTANDNTKNIVRIVNGVFHPDNFDTFLTLNDRKSRRDFETGPGANNMNFWSLIADYVNDLNNEDLDYFRVDDNDELYKDYIKIAEDAGCLPVACSQQTGKTCKAIIKGVIKIRGTMIANMTKSGQNDNNPYMYTGLAIKRHSLVRSVSDFAAYYFFMKCVDHPEMDG